MISLLTTSALLLAGSQLSAAAPFSSHDSTNDASKQCRDFIIPVPVTSSNVKFALPKFKNNYDVMDFVDTMTSRNPTTAGSVVSPERETVSATYKIAGTICHPTAHHTSSHEKGNTLLIATHGLNFDRSYWNAPGLDPAKYSFADAVLAQGYSVLFYDRLGTGKSEHVSGYVAQLANQVAILTKLTEIVKSGEHAADFGPKPDRVVLVGHSFGSILSLNTVAESPDLVDGVVLTGFSLNKTVAGGFLESVGVRIAAEQDPSKWGDLDTGYVTPVDIFSNVEVFFKAPDYTQDVAKYADEHKAPFAVGEVLPDSKVPSPPYAFKGVAMIITGKYDFPFCDSDCDGALEDPAAEDFKHASAFKAVVFPGAGHGINFHLNAAGAFKEITDYLEAHGL